MLAAYEAQGGVIKRVARGKRGHSRSYVRDVTGDDDARAAAQAREDYRRERRAMRRAARAKREAV